MGQEGMHGRCTVVLNGVESSCDDANLAWNILDDGPVHYWRLNGSSGSADVVGGAYAAATGEGITFDRRGGLAADPDYGTSFIDSTHRLEVDVDSVSHDGSPGLSLEFWARTENGGTHYIAEQRNRFSIRQDSVAGELQFHVRVMHDDIPVSNWLSAPAADFFDGRWHHVVATYSGASMALFLDGELIGSESHPGAVLEPEYALHIGGPRYRDGKTG